jgi:hypothetical protein
MPQSPLTFRLKKSQHLGLGVFLFVHGRTVPKLKSRFSAHRVHRVVMSAFWRTFSHGGKIWAGEGGGCTPHPLLLHLPAPVKLQCTLQLSGQIQWPCFISCKDMYSVVPPFKADAKAVYSLYVQSVCSLYKREEDGLQQMREF